jgi:hypothetical protein
MKIENCPIATLSPDPANLRKHSQRNLDAIAASLRKFGQQKPLVVDKNNIVLAGNGTLAAAKSIGWTEIKIVRSDLAGVSATAFGIADNRTAELAEWDEKLGEMLQALKAENVSLPDIGFDELSLSQLLAAPVPVEAGTTNANDEWAGMPEFANETEAFRKVIVSLASAEDAKAFFAAIGQDYNDTTKSVWFPERARRNLKDQMWVEENEGAEDKFSELK